MSAIETPLELATTPDHLDAQPTATDKEQNIIDYYRAATFGYRDWSPNINMHFGFYERGMNPFNLEAMLENTNRQVFNTLNLTTNNNHLLDMGCGLGATARFCATQEQVSKITGITLVDTQIQEAQELSTDVDVVKKLDYQLANYHNTPFSDNSFDGIYAIESACHSPELDKRSLLTEAFRLLKPGSRLVICDGFTKGLKPFNPIMKFCYKKTCEHWSLGNLGELNSVVGTMTELGFRNIQIRNISMNIAPSAAYVPWVSLKFFIKLLLTRDTNRQHWNHLLAPLWALPLALHLHRTGYYLVSGEK